MNTAIDLTAIPALAAAAIVAILFFAAVGVVCIGEYIRMGYRGDMRHRRDEKQEPASEPAEPVSAPEPAVEVQVYERPAPDLLPPAPPHVSEVPIYGRMPVGLPQCDSIDWRFEWERPAVPFPTGSFPVVVLNDDIEGYQVSAVPARQLPGFEVDEAARKHFRPTTDAALREAAELLAAKRERRKVSVDLGELGVRTAEVSA